MRPNETNEHNTNGLPSNLATSQVFVVFAISAPILLHLHILIYSPTYSNICWERDIGPHPDIKIKHVHYKLVTEALSSLDLVQRLTYLLHCAKNLAHLEDLINLTVAREKRS